MVDHLPAQYVRRSLSSTKLGSRLKTPGPQRPGVFSFQSEVPALSVSRSYVSERHRPPILGSPLLQGVRGLGSDAAEKRSGQREIAFARYLKCGSTSAPNLSSERRAFAGSSPGSCITVISSVIGVDSNIASIFARTSSAVPSTLVFLSRS